MCQRKISKRQSVILQVASLDNLCRLQELGFCSWDIATGIIHMAHHVRYIILSSIRILAVHDIFLHHLNNVVGIVNVHTPQVVHDTAHPRVISSPDIIILTGMVQKSDTGIVNKSRRVLPRSHPHGLLQPLVLCRILALRPLCRYPQYRQERCQDKQHYCTMVDSHIFGFLENSLQR